MDISAYRPSSIPTWSLLPALFMLVAISAYADGSRQQRPQVMIVGVAHFVSHRDVHNSKLADIMSPAHQEEIKTVVDNLLKFAPTKVMIEQPIGSETIGQQYQKYLAGDFTLGPNEVYQLGFRLAALAGDKAIYPIDTNTDFPFDLDAVKFSAKQYGQTGLLDEAETEVTATIVQHEGDLEEHGTILELLRYLNLTDTIDKNASWYMYIDRVGSGKDYAGADLVSYWYARNLHIFANMMRSIDSRTDRVVVFIGSGHVQQLSNYVRLSPDLELVDPEPYLK